VVDEGCGKVSGSLGGSTGPGLGGGPGRGKGTITIIFFLFLLNGNFNLYDTG
jgi:hypothetical protein